MNFNKVVIKQIPDSSNQSAYGLEKYNRSKFPGCTEAFQVALLPDGRYLTGLDPNGYELSFIKDPAEREKKVQERISISDNLKKLLPNVDLSPMSEFWSEFKIVMSTDSDLTLTKYSPIDIVKYYALVSNGIVAPSKDEIGNPYYRDAKYYCSVEEVEELERFSVQKLKDQATYELVKIGQNKDLMLLIGKYLEGTRYKDNMLPTTLYTNLSNFIHSKDAENVTKFLKAIALPLEDLQFKVTIDTALRKKIIKFTNGQYTRGAANLGKTVPSVIANLKLPEFAAEFAQIYEEING